MKAICVTPERAVEVRDIPTPTEAAPGHLLIDMNASAINHGDIVFLKMPNAAGTALAGSLHDIWGVSGAGRVVAVGTGVPAEYAGRNVAIYRSLGHSPLNIGVWSERVHMAYTNCLILPEQVDARDYSGSLVNVMTAYAFLEEIAAAGHKGVIVTAGNSATGRAMLVLARQRQMPAIFLVRTEAARAELLQAGAEHVIVTGAGFTAELQHRSAELQTTAVFDGVGGELFATIAPVLPMHSTVYVYGLLGGAAPLAVHGGVILMKDLTLRRFSNFASRTVAEPERLIAALKALQDVIADPLMRTQIGQEFSYAQIEQALAYQSATGAKAILVP